MVKVYGASDDLVEIEGSSYPKDEIGCFMKDVKITFEDGTVVLIWYGKKGIWYINLLASGSAYKRIRKCYDPEAEPHSDVLEIDSEISDLIVKEAVHYGRT